MFALFFFCLHTRIKQTLKQMKNIVMMLLLAAFVCGCASNRYEDGAWEVAETSATNGDELSRFLKHYRDGGDREKPVSWSATCRASIPWRRAGPSMTWTW